MPPDDHLGRRLAVLASDLGDAGIAEVAPLPQRAPALDHDVVVPMEVADGPLLERRMQFDLVHHRYDAGFPDEALAVVRIEVREANRTDPPVLLQLHQRLPSLDVLATLRQRPVDEKQVEDINLQFFHGLIERAHGVVIGVPAIAQLARDEQLVARYPALP